MANRRMISKTIIDSDYFLEMPLSAQCLYFHLLARADDDGFIDSPKKIMRMLGATEDDLKLLLAKQFIIAFESGVIVIKHWRIHNYIRGDRYKPTFYRKEKAMLELDETNTYCLVYQRDTNGIPTDIPDDIPPDIPDGIPDDIPMVAKRETQVRLGKVNINKKDKEEVISKVVAYRDNSKNYTKKPSTTSSFFEKTNNNSKNSEESSNALKGNIEKLTDEQYISYIEQEFKNIPEKIIERWKKQYPDADVEVEMLKALDWLKDHPKKRRKDVKRFMVNWLKKVKPAERGFQFQLVL